MCALARGIKVREYGRHTLKKSKKIYDFAKGIYRKRLSSLLPSRNYNNIFQNLCIKRKTTKCGQLMRYLGRDKKVFKRFHSREGTVCMYILGEQTLGTHIKMLGFFDKTEKIRSIPGATFLRLKNCSVPAEIPNKNCSVLAEIPHKYFPRLSLKRDAKLIEKP